MYLRRVGRRVFQVHLHEDCGEHQVAIFRQLMSVSHPPEQPSRLDLNRYVHQCVSAAFWVAVSHIFWFGANMPLWFVGNDSYGMQFM